ncbi:QRFP-like peptide receptor isoform X1 [Hydra vulgaris]|uniref:QRFP-like peptide receptor isoform X1 n=2 Tax=Hydra vulgaris TaxID=6087 RepID=UPI001F5EE85D|nr:QRFP-like peptide receptor isoform X1 [Hydra vulgaris]
MNKKDEGAMNNSSLFAEDNSIPLKVQNVVFISIAVLAIFGNGIFLVSVLRSKRKHLGLSEYLVCNLAFCNFFLVVTSIPLQVIEINIGYFPLGSYGCYIMYPLATWALISVTETLLFLSFERFIAIKYPFKYIQLKKFSKMIIWIFHLISIASVIPYAINLHIVEHDNLPQCEEKWSKQISSIYTVSMFVIQYGIPLPVMSAFYIVAIIEIKKQNDEFIKISEKQYSSFNNNRLKLSGNSINTNLFIKLRAYGKTVMGSRYKSSNSQKRQKQTVSIFKLFLIIVFLFAICMIPNQIVWLCKAFDKVSVSGTWSTICYWLTYTNSVLNPILYGINNRFRKFYKVLFRPCCRVIDKQLFYSESFFQSKTENILSRTSVSVPKTGKRKERIIENFHSVENDQPSLLEEICYFQRSVSYRKNTITEY